MMRSRRHSSGFSIVELMTVLAIVGIFLAWALPSFLETIRTNRVTSRTNDLVLGMSLARSEAIRRSTAVSVCASSDQTTCSGDWSGGWVVFVDPDANGVVGDATNDIVRVSQADENVDATANSNFRVVTFNERGLTTGAPSNPADRVITVYPHTDCTTGREYRRAIALSTTGQTAVRKLACS